MKLTAKAYAKLNLTLDILDTMPNGYHNIETVFQSVSLCDIITLESGKDKISVTCSKKNVPENEDNICYSAVTQFFKKAGIHDGVSIYIEKHIPEAAGLGGGSADAASVLLMLNEAYPHTLGVSDIRSIATSLGADIPFCTVGGTCLATGIGENLKPLAHCPECDIILIKQGVKPSTASLYKRYDGEKNPFHPDTAAEILALEQGDIRNVAKYVGNCFAPLWGSDIANIKSQITGKGALTAELTGSGPTVFGIFKKGEGKAIAEHFRKQYPETFLCNPTKCGVEIISKTN